MPIQMHSGETDFDIVYLFGIPNQAKNINISSKQLFTVLYLSSSRLCFFIVI